MIYDDANRLSGVTGAGLSASYGYNGLGDRLRQVINGQTTDFSMDLNRGLTQVLSDGTNTYLYGNARLGQESVSGMAYYLADTLGSVRQLVDGSGVSLSRAYEPYGEELSSSGSGTTSYGFTGEYYDTETKLIHLRARYYSPATGRFISQDAWDGNTKQPMSYIAWLYAYANPVNWTDPTGAKPIPDDEYGWSHSCNPLVGNDRWACEKIIRGISPYASLPNGLESIIYYVRDECTLQDLVGPFAKAVKPYQGTPTAYGYWYHWLLEFVPGWWNSQGKHHVSALKVATLSFSEETGTGTPQFEYAAAEAFGRKIWDPSHGFYNAIGGRSSVWGEWMQVSTPTVSRLKVGWIATTHSMGLGL